ncbi:MAG: phosphotransferase [Actinobacteria bacterium]|nr:phosphotransferase [Actinomycetota bacterium]
MVGGALTAEDAGRVLSSACAVVGLDATGAVLRRIGTHAVFRLASPVVVRITGAAEALARAERTVGVARWLAEVDFPAVRVLPGVEQPVVVAGRVVTFWVLIADEERWAELGQVGDLIRRLHWLEEPRALRLPRLDPLGETWRRIEGSVGLGADDRAFLWARAETLSKRYDELDFVLPFGMVHGDAQVGNALRDGSGRAVLIDLDGFAVGPREWDLVLTALYFERFGWHTRSEYDAFVHSYGFDVMNWYGYQTLADMRELMMTVWLSRGMTTDETVAAEVRRRIGDLRSGAERRGWQPF